MPTSYQDIIGAYNLAKTDSNLNTTMVPNITNYGADSEGNSYITYSFFTTGQEIGDSYYTDGGDEETYFAMSYNQDIENAAFGILNDGNYWASSFSNSIKVNFIEPSNHSNSAYHNDVGILAFGQLTGSHPVWLPGTAAGTAPYDTNNGSIADEVYGDIFLNVDHQGSSSGLEPGDNIWTDFGDIEKGTFAYKTIYEEVAHALGIDFVDATGLVLPASESTQKYTITSYAPYGYIPDTNNSNLPVVDSDPLSVVLYGEDNDSDGNQDVLNAYGLQLYDIAALQDLYGRDYLARTNDDEYKLGQGLGRDGNSDNNIDSSDKGSAFIYTIWDGAGVDTLDASGFDTFSAKIDLRQGEFSSIGTDGKSGDLFDWSIVSGDVDIDVDAGNVAIAYHTVIENAVGTINADLIIGNEWGNKLEGGNGNDRIYGDGEVLDDDDALDTVITNGIITSGEGFLDIDVDDTSTSAIDESAIDPNATRPENDNDHLIGGAGDDILYGGDGQDILDGGADDDELYGGTNDMVSKFAERDIADYSTVLDTGSFAITIEKSDLSAFDFKVTGNASGTDYLKDIEVFRGTNSTLDEIDFSGYSSPDYTIRNQGNDHFLDYDDGSGTIKTYEFQNFENLTLNSSDNEVTLAGVGGINIDGGAGTDTAIIEQGNFVYSNRLGFYQGEGLYVSSSETKNTVDNTTYENFEKFNNVGYAHITALGHDYSYDNATFVSFLGMTLDYSDYASALTFDLDAGEVHETGNPSGTKDTVASAETRFILGTDHGDTIDTNTNLHSFFSGTGNDVVLTSPTRYYYSGGNDVISFGGTIYMPSSIDETDLTFEMINDTSGGKDIKITVNGLGSITVEAATLGVSILTHDTSGDSVSYRLDAIYDAASDEYTFSVMEQPASDFATMGDDVTSHPAGFDGDDIMDLSSVSQSLILITGGKGNDTITGTVNDDEISGDAGNDSLYGGAGNDTLYAGTGTDTLDGQAGDHDHAIYYNNTSALYVDLSQSGANADENYDGSTPSYEDTLTNIENVTATVFDDVLIGDSNANELHGLQGDDVYTGNGGADTFFIGNGLDTITDFSVADGDTISVEHIGVAGFSDLEIVETDLGSQVLAEIFVAETDEKIAEAYLGSGESLSSSQFDFRSYEPPTNTATGDNIPIADATTGELVFDNNYKPREYFKTVVQNSGSLEGTAGIISDEQLVILQSAWDNGVQNEIVWLSGVNDTSAYAYVGTDTTRILISKASPYEQAFYGSGGSSLNPDDESGSHAALTIPIPDEDGNGNDGEFIFNGDDKTTSTAYTDYVEEDVNAGTDIVTIKNTSLSDTYFTTSTTGDLIINFVGYANYKIQIQGNYHTDHGSDITERVELIVFENGSTVETVNISEGLTISGTSANEDVDGSVRDDTLYGLAGNDTLNGGDGDDTLIGGAGKDIMYGDRSDDTYVFESGFGLGQGSSADIVIEKLDEGIDTAYFTGGILPDDVRSWVDTGGDLRIRLGDSSNDEVEFQANHNSGAGSDIGERLERIVFDNGTVWDLTNGLTLSDTNDGHTIYGSVLNDTIDGRGGNDKLYGFAGDDILIGGSGTDRTYGDVGDDTYVFESGFGRDYITEDVGEGSDTILFVDGILLSDVGMWVDSGEDLHIELIATGDEVEVYAGGSSGTDLGSRIEQIVFSDQTKLDFTQGLTLIDTDDGHRSYGSALTDMMDGRGGNDRLYGYAEDDILKGGDGSDYLYGGDDDDVLYGGAGVDMLYGQDGADIFAFDNLSSSDNIQDFDIAEGDKLDVSDLLIGYDPLTDAITDFVQITESGSNSYLKVDADGGADNFVQVAYIYNETGLTDEAALETSGNLITV